MKTSKNQNPGRLESDSNETDQQINPFATPLDGRDPVRRARGRLVSPVTIVTSSGSGGPAGLTVSSLVIAEGDPGVVYLLVGPTTELYDALIDSSCFVVHICEAAHREIADVFAGTRPSPGGVFSGRDLQYEDHGPVLAEIKDRIYCTVIARREESYSVLVTGIIDRVEMGNLLKPLSFFRGRYRGLH